MRPASCARAASGHVAVVPSTIVINSRRLADDRPRKNCTYHIVEKEKRCAPQQIRRSDDR